MFKDLDKCKENLQERFVEFLKSATAHSGFGEDAASEFSELFKPILEKASAYVDSSESLYDLLFDFAVAFTCAARNFKDCGEFEQLSVQFAKDFGKSLLDGAVSWRQEGELEKSEEADDEEDDDEDDYCDDDVLEVVGYKRVDYAAQDAIEQAQWEEQLREKERQKELYRAQLAQLEIQREQAWNHYWQNGKNTLDYQVVRKLDIEIDRLKSKIR